MADAKISDLTEATSVDGTEYVEMVQSGSNKKVSTSILSVTREIGRVWTDTLLFDKNEISYAVKTMDDDINFTLSAGVHLTDAYSSAVQTITVDGIHAINFEPSFNFLYGIQNGEILEAGTYEFYFLYLNGTVSVNVPGVTSQQSSQIVLPVVDDLAAVADGENEIDLSWTTIPNNSGYLIEVSETGTGGWSELTTTVEDATSASQSALNAGDIRYYRIKTLGDGISFLDSAFSSPISGQTESSSDVTAPTFQFVPASGNTVWTVNRSITITADEPIRNTDGSEITNANVGTRITLKETNSGGANISFTATIDSTKTIITISPTTDYGENQLVYVAINNVEDVNGNEVTVAISSTFTTTEYTFFNGITNRLQFGDILDSIWPVNDIEFWIEITLNNAVTSGTRILWSKWDESTGTDKSIHLYIQNGDILFAWYGPGSSPFKYRVIKWAGAATSGEHTYVLKYDGSIDTNDGLDRATLEIDGTPAGSKSLVLSASTLPQIRNSTAQLAVGAHVTSGGSLGSSWMYTEEAKDFIIRTSAGSVVQLNVPNLKLGTDISGNGLNGTWV